MENSDQMTGGVEGQHHNGEPDGHGGHRAGQQQSPGCDLADTLRTGYIQEDGSESDLGDRLLKLRKEGGGDDG
jgi:hypothetical protein